MAKCVGSVIYWSPTITTIDAPNYLVDDVRQGEIALKDRVESKSSQLLLDIASDFIKIKQSAICDEEFKLNCSQVQEALAGKLNVLYSETASVIRSISGSTLTPSTKHRYFIQYTYGHIEKFEQLFQMVGRMSEIDQKLYSEEQRKLLISDESITIHSMTYIWTAILEILNDFCHIAPAVFNASSNNENKDCDEEEYDFLDQLEFSTARLHLAKTLLMDIIITCWIKFNRLVKYDDLVKSIPFLCNCHMKIFFKTLDGMTEANVHILNELINFVLDYQSQPSMMTISARRPGVIPFNPCYADSNQSCLAYFIIWNLYALSTRVKEPIKQSMLLKCNDIFQRSFEIVQESFLTSLINSKRMSPHQEERYKLLFHMLNVWCETHKHHSANNNAVMLRLLFKFAHEVDSLKDLETKYFDNPNFTVAGLTLFQLCTKLFNETVPLYVKNCQLDASGENSGNNNGDKSNYTTEQNELIKIWITLIDKNVATQASNPIASTSAQAI